MHALVAGQVCVEVDEPGQERGVAEIDDAGTGRNAHALSNLDDALALDANHRRPYRRCTGTVDELCGLQDRDLRSWSLGGADGRRNEHDRGNDDTTRAVTYENSEASADGQAHAVDEL